VNEALSYPTPETFSQVIGFTNRPLSLKDSYLPSDLRLSLKSGVELSGDVSSIMKALKEIEEIEKIEKITHVYFTVEMSCRCAPNQLTLTVLQHMFTRLGEPTAARSRFGPMSSC
jgi:hypothetical protein